MNTFAYRHKKSTDYFEGWYTRITDLKNDLNYAVIFGITNSKQDPHAFIQLYDGITLTNTYVRFDVSEFSYLNQTVSIGANSLSLKHLTLELGEIFIHTHFSNVSILKGKNNSAMGFLVHAPLQCFQEVNMMNGLFSGDITKNKMTRTISGKIYMEKTYGNKFPTKWIWLQCNHFPQDISLTFAYGKIPFLFWKLNGFMAILHVQEKEYRFTSYNLSKMKIDHYDTDKVKITLRKKTRKLTLDATLIQPVEIVGPTKKGIMNLLVLESINSTLTAEFTEKNNILFHEEGSKVGLEIMDQ
ncbi:MAG: tocopherol cyclase family protein [Firmicutes bacterium]|nr:tocopherol cyclase family protein [Bacillota bacterium]